MTAGLHPAADAAGLPVTDLELEALALAADPDTAVAPDALCLWDLAGWERADLLPTWYMPAPMRGASAPTWQRWLIGLIVASFLLIDGFGLCSTYGWVSFG
jgi:hypothetical protein